MLLAARLVRFKGFRDCIIPLEGDSVLVGANNAGKSTVVSGLRLIAAMVPQMRRIKPQTGGVVDGEPMRGWYLTNAALEGAAFLAENVRYDFGREESRFEAHFDNGTRVVIVWPEHDEDQDGESTSHILVPKNFTGSFVEAARKFVPDIGVVPSLAPLDERELMITDDAFRRNITSRRTSRYFRNALWRVSQEKEDWTAFRSFVGEHTPEVGDLQLRNRAGERGEELDLFYREPGKRSQREITWAGDGIQIWLQALYHIWRERDAPILVLDEPDVYLHPDLQRRLARVTFGGDHQTILATHSTELLAAAEPGSAVWIDRNRRRAERPKRDGALSLLGRRLGSGLELSVARALRSRVALFVEGEDMNVLAEIASIIGARTLAAGSDYAVVQLGGLSRYGVAGAFSEVVTALGGQVAVEVILDRDLRCSEAADFIVQDLAGQNATVHMWARRELENYVLAPAALARATGLDVAEAKLLLDGAVDDLRDDTLLAFQTQRLEERDKGLGSTRAISHKTILERCGREFEKCWRTEEGRLATVDAKKVIKSLNSRLGPRKVSITAKKLACHLTLSEVPTEMVDILKKVETTMTKP